MIFIREFFTLFLLPFSLSLLCKDGNFNQVLINNENNFEIGPETEACYEYSFSKIKSKIGFVFPNINSTSAEVILYKSKSDISIKGNSYQNYYDRFLISENSFKEIDVTKLEENKIYIIIRDIKYSKIYTNYFILYDNQIPILLHDGKPITMKYFFSDNVYRFIYHSNNNLTFVYSSKVKLKKYINIAYNDVIKAEKKIDDSDIMLYLVSENRTEKYLYVSIEDIEPGTEDQEFSLIVYEKGITEFIEIKRNEIINLNYINLNVNDETQTQTFFFYFKMGNITKTNTINFKLDNLAKKTQYINIISGSYHSVKELKSDDFEKNFRLDENRLPIEYDLNSDEYKKIYYQDNDTSFPYRYIFFKIEITKLENYYSPKTIKITIGEELKEINLVNIDTYHTKTITMDIKPYFPTYFKLKLNPKEKYIFNSPYPKNTIYIKGDLVERDENQNIIINKNYFVDEDEIFVFSNITEFTVAVFCSESFKSIFYLEKYDENELYIIENMRNNDPFEITFKLSDCLLGRKKYLLGIYNKEFYSRMNKTYTKYWTTNDGVMKVYYRNNITLEGISLFPILEKYKVNKENYIYINNYIDFFTFTCAMPGTLTLRSPYKIFNETTHKIGQNTISTLDISSEIEVIQLTTPIEPPTKYLYFAIFSKNGKELQIFPDEPKLFNEIIIKGDEIFTLKIDLYKFEPDQLAIKVKPVEKTQIEVIEIIRYNFTKYTILESNRMHHITDNHFVRFLDNNSKKIKVRIRGLNNIDAVYGLVKLFTNDVNYLPMAYQFKDSVIRKKIKNNEIIEINNTYYGNNDRKKYLAFIFSIPYYFYYEFDAQVIQDFEEEYKNDDYNNNNNNNNNLNNEDKINIGIIILVFTAIIIIIIIIVLIYFFFIKKKETKNKYEMEVDDNSPIEKDNLFKGFNIN